MNAIAGGAQHRERRAWPLGLEPGRERIGEQHHLRAIAGPIGCFQERRRVPFGQRPARAQPQHRLANPTQQARAIAPSGQESELRHPWCIAWQPPDQAIAPGEPAHLGAAALHFDFHPRHIDAGGAFALAPLAPQAQSHRFRHRIGRERVRPELPGEREPQAIGAAAGHVLLVAGGAKRRTHHPGRGLAAGAVVVAHLDRGAGNRRSRPPPHADQSSAGLYGAGA